MVHVAATMHELLGITIQCCMVVQSSSRLCLRSVLPFHQLGQAAVSDRLKHCCRIGRDSAETQHAVPRRPNSMCAVAMPLLHSCACMQGEE